MLETRWQKGWARLQEFVAREGHAAVPDYHIEDGFRLGMWASELHSMFNHWKTLPQERIELLDNLEDWQWNWQDVYHSKNNPYPRAHIEPRRTFIAMNEDERTALAFDYLTGMGIIDDTEAIKCVGDPVGLTDRNGKYKKFVTDAELVDAVNGAIESAIERGYLDRPRPGFIRAVLATPEDYSVEDWCLCMVGVLSDRPLRRQETIRRTQRWAEEHSGLKCEELAEISKVRECLDATIQIDIDRGHIEVMNSGRLRRSC